MALLFDALFDTVDEGQEARPKKLLKSKVQTSRANKGFDTAILNWCNVAQLALQTPVPETLMRPPSEPIRLGSDIAGYGTESLACHYLGVNYKVAFVAERSSVKDTLRMTLGKKTCHPQETHSYVF
jgi:hypothetical protein